MFADKIRTTVGGDAKGGFLVDLHDGLHNPTYRPEGVKTPDDAVKAALADHAKEFPEAPTATDYEFGTKAGTTDVTAPAASEDEPEEAPAASIDAEGQPNNSAEPAAVAESTPEAEEGAAPAASDEANPDGAPTNG